MTHIVSCKTKKELKERLADGRGVYFDDPSIFNPWSVHSSDMQAGESLTCTNHPKRSWFALVKRTDTGFKVS